MIFAAIPLAANAFELTFPVDCTIGKTCFVQQLVDHDPGPGLRDYACGTLTYDGHKGSDIALPTLADMSKGVAVLAAAPGTVRAVRDGMADQLYTPDQSAAIAGRDCGNGVVLTHEDGWETQYCHLKQGSLTVRQGDIVQTGAALGEVGLSGKTQFPHLHLTLRKDGKTIDPFAPEASADCTRPAADLWADTPAHPPGGLIYAGLAEAVPDYADVKAGTVATINRPDAPALVLYALGYASKAGDNIVMQIHGPMGEFLSQTITLDKAQAQYFRAVGRKLRAPSWPKGTYTGTVTLRRDGRDIAKIETSTQIPAAPDQ